MVVYKQDMPPPGGYATLNFQKVPAKTWNIWLKVGAYLGITTVGWFIVSKQQRKFENEKIENLCAKLALYPLITAEQDRMILKQLKKNRDDEEKLMADDPNWEVGKLKDMPVFITVKPNEYVNPSYLEYFAHCDPKHFSTLKHSYLNI